MKLIDTKTNEIVADIITNHSMCIDEILSLMDITVDPEGQLVDSDGSRINAWYDDLEMKDKPFDIPDILESLRRDVLSGALTIETAAEELCSAGWMNYIDMEKTKALLGIAEIDKEPTE